MTRLLAITALIWTWGCGESAPEDCSHQTGRAADLCWSQKAEQALPADLAAFSEAFEHISDTQLRDITVLAVVRKMEDPKDRFALCQRIGDPTAKERCLLFEIRVHLWGHRSPGEESTKTPVPAGTQSSPDCADLPEGLRDACELEAVLSAGGWGRTTTPGPVPDGARCLAIRELEARGLCQAEVATQIAHAKGLEAGVSACQAIEMSVYRKDCLLRVRTTHPEAPMEQQLEICAMAEGLSGPCHVMVSISAPAHLLEEHGAKPTVEALAAIAKQISEYRAAVSKREGAQKAESLTRTIWYRLFSRVISPRSKRDSASVDTLRRWVPVLMGLEPTAPHLIPFRASLLRAYGATVCLGDRMERDPLDNGQSAPLPTWCRTPEGLAQHFRDWLNAQEMDPASSSRILAPLVTQTVDASDWWAVYNSDPGRIPLAIVHGCPMDTAAVDDLAAMTALAGGSWNRHSGVFRVGLQSKQATVRDYTVRRLIRHLFTERFRLEARDQVIADLRTWLPELAPGMRDIVKRLVNDIERGERRQPIELSRWQKCPGQGWPSETVAQSPD